MAKSKPVFQAQVWNRYHGEWQDVKQSLPDEAAAKNWFFINPDKRRVLDNGRVVFQPRD